MTTMRKPTCLPMIVAALGAVAVIAAGANVNFAANQAPVSIKDLNRMGRYLGRSVTPEELGTIKAAGTSGLPETRALRAALLYRADPAQWSSELQSTFSINDYDERARGKTNEVTQEEFISRITALEARHPSLEPRLVMLIAFVDFRDANLWFPQGGQKISAARFFRTAFLEQAFKGSDLNAEAVANELDQTARQEFARRQKAKK